MKVFQACMRLPERQIFRQWGRGRRVNTLTKPLRSHPIARMDDVCVSVSQLLCVLTAYLSHCSKIVTAVRPYFLAPPIIGANIYRVFFTKHIYYREFERLLKVAPCGLITEPPQTSARGWRCSMHTSVYPGQHIDY